MLLFHGTCIIKIEQELIGSETRIACGGHVC